MKFITDFINKFRKAYKDSQIWTKIETSEDLKNAYKASHEQPVAILTHATMHFRSEYMMSDFEKQARRMDLSPVKFYKLNFTGNSALKHELGEDLKLEPVAGLFLLFKDGKLIFKRHEELINMEALLKKLAEYSSQNV